MAKTERPRQAEHSTNVVAHPSSLKIPECLFPLNTEPGRKEYATLAALIFTARGGFTAGTHRALSSYAAQFDNISAVAAAGKQIRAASYIQLDKAREALNLDEIEKPQAATQGARTNKFARNGFSCRSKQAVR